jgi:hypothetical protein
MPFGEYVDAVVTAFRVHAEGRAVSPAPLHIRVEGGGFHVKSASLPLGRRYVAIKTNSNFPQNRSLRDLPTIQGAILLLDADDGTPLAFLDSMEITLKRPAPRRPSPAAISRGPILEPRRFAAAASRAAFSSLRFATSSTSSGLRMGQGCRGRCWIRRRNVEATRHRRSDGANPARGHPGKRRHRDMHPVA